jgi:hypothetical protein
MTATTCQQLFEGPAETNEVCIVENPFFDMTALFSRWLVMVWGISDIEKTFFKVDLPFKYILTDMNVYMTVIKEFCAESSLFQFLV